MGQWLRSSGERIRGCLRANLRGCASPLPHAASYKVRNEGPLAYGLTPGHDPPEKTPLTAPTRRVMGGGVDRLSEIIDSFNTEYYLEKYGVQGIAR